MLADVLADVLAAGVEEEPSFFAGDDVEDPFEEEFSDDDAALRLSVR